ncbi:MAG: Wzz/FepE/Etk N-terminal domain-containing protein [Luteolibacter sp.]
MQKSEKTSTKEAFGVQDILYILFKHKWKILIFSLLGFAASAVVYLTRKPIYQTEAKLLVKYVLVRENVDTSQSQLNSVGGMGGYVMNTEIEILQSVDLALTVAEAIGVDRLLPESGGKATLADAASTILGNLEVTVAPANNVIHLLYSNSDAELAKLVLREFVKQYFVKHLEIHRSAAAFDMVSKQAEEAEIRLKETERQLDKLKTESGIVSLADATGALSGQRAKTQEDLMKARAELAEQEARMKALNLKPESTRVLVNGASTYSPDHGADMVKQVPGQTITEYKSILEILAFLQKRDLELRIKFKQGNRLITLNQQQIVDNESKRRELVAKYPQLATDATLLAHDSRDPQLNLFEDQAHLAALNARVEAYGKHLDEIRKQFNEQYAIGAEIEILDRKKQMEDAEYRSLELNLKNAKIDQTLDPSRMPNISILQQPSQPIKTYDKVVQKVVFGLAGGGVALGLGLAFLIELLFDRRVKRSFEIQTRLQLPLLLSIPYIRQKERGGLMLSHESSVARIGRNEASLPALHDLETAPDPAQRRASHFILPYSETIRDRIIFNFEVNNVTHKPKLVAVTGLSEGAGSSTIAAGLAKSFSEINGAKVLLVDLSSYTPQDNPMFGEIPRHSLSGALQLARNNKFKENTQNLYYASANARRDDTGLTTFSPMHLYELMPHLQASQYDYIIFDMPPIDQTSRTLTMAGLMDKVLLVLDAENTSRDALKWGYSELVKGKADVSCIFNKTRNHAPGWLIGDN